jgi:hypothetical protein
MLVCIWSPPLFVRKAPNRLSGGKGTGPDLKRFPVHRILFGGSSAKLNYLLNEPSQPLESIGHFWLIIMLVIYLDEFVLGVAEDALGYLGLDAGLRH